MDIAKEHQCELCQTTFSSCAPNVKFCPRCRLHRDNEIKRIPKERRRQENRKKGLCACGRSPEPKRKKCRSCLEQSRLAFAKNREASLCSCGAFPVPGKKHCAPCLAKAARWRDKLRDKVFAHYGKVCACCGESERAFLTIDHSARDGNKHPKNVRKNLYHWIVQNNFPKGLRTFCYNCNLGRERNSGVCPHQKLKPPLSSGFKCDRASG